MIFQNERFPAMPQKALTIEQFDVVEKMLLGHAVSVPENSTEGEMFEAAAFIVRQHRDHLERERRAECIIRVFPARNGFIIANGAAQWIAPSWRGVKGAIGELLDYHAAKESGDDPDYIEHLAQQEPPRPPDGDSGEAAETVF